MKSAFVFLNGVMDAKSSFYKEILEGEKDIFCADGGLRYALEIGVTPLELWGDLDSIDGELVERARDLGTEVRKFNPRKNMTDGELLISEISERGYEKIVVLGGLGGRTDHLLTNLNLLFKYENLFFVNERETIFKAYNNLEICGKRGCTISFIPMSDYIDGLTLKGFEYPLENYRLRRGDSLCNSNVISEDLARVEFLDEDGRLLACLEKNS